AAPVRTRFGRSGLVLCEQYDQPRVWRERERSLLAAVVNQLAIAIEQAQLYEQSQNAAAVAQAHAEQLKQALEELQRTQAHLVQTEKMSALGLLTAGLAHEIKNPVSFVCGNLTYAQEYAAAAIALIQLYQQHFPDPPAAIRDLEAEIELDFLLEDFPKTLTSMAVGADRIQELVLSLRNFSRTDQTGQETVDLHAGLDSALLILSHRLQSRGGHTAIEVVKDYGTLPAIACYPSQLNQVFVNLIGNAIDALEAQTQAGDPAWIKIRTTATAEQIEIAIADNGPGIPAAIQSQLFDPFFTTKPSGKGTGLGLSISQQIVAKHGGRLQCRSEPGGGTEFVLQLQVASKSISPVNEVA
ncbi:MAG: GHKL domain-containing protein, partial [Spirulinaceae cyanobacterium RM2_2_10]|nr:GHKL domain-containing protein [Spirulinaceae cyanobacterium RM2_2_10]